MTAPDLKTSRRSRRYRRATLTTGRVEVFLTVGVVVALLMTLSLVVLSSPLSGVVAALVLLVGGLVVLADNRHEDDAGRGVS